MKKLVLILIAFAFFACDNKETVKEDDPPNEETSVVDTKLEAAAISAEDKKEADDAITDDNVEAEADALMKEIENDEE